MKQYETTEEDLKRIRAIQKHDPTIIFLKNKDKFNFTTGDFLIKLNRRNDSWQTEMASSISNVPKRFLCIHEDEYGVRYIRQLTSKGDIIAHVIPLVQFSEYTRFELDPEFAEHIILNGEEEFDFTQQKKKEKARRDRITRLNKKIAVKFSSLSDVRDFLKSKSPGEKLWIGWTIPEAAGAEFEIIDIVALDSDEHTYIKVQNNQYAHKPIHLMAAIDLLRVVVITSEPHSYSLI